MVINFTFLVLVVILAFIMLIIKYLKTIKNKTKLHQVFIDFMWLLIFPFIALGAQILFSKTSIKPVYFDYATYIFTVFGPIKLLEVAILYLNKNADIKKLRILYIISAISLLTLWTNDLHHLFYKVYSINLNETIFGPFLILLTIYSYAIIIISMGIFAYTSVKNSGFFSKQTALIIVGIAVPLLANILGVFKIISMTIYMTPILFVFLSVCFAISVFKFKALSITPVAFRTVIDTMSDAFVVVSDDGTIVEKNDTFDRKLSDVLNVNKEDNLFNAIESKTLLDLKDLQGHIEETRKTNGIVTEEYHIVSGNFDKYFEVDIHPIKAKHGLEYIGTLLLFKDVTQHKQDIQEIKDKQDVIVKQGQLVSIGELAGGMAHDINTPISAIKTGIEMLQTIYTPRDETEKEVLFRMNNCSEKIIKIVNSMRNQIRNLGSDQMINFKVSDVIEDIRIVSFNELQKNGSKLTVNIQDDLYVYGDPTKLGQVFTNLFVNAAQAYGDKGGKIEVDVSTAPNSMVMIKVRDYAGGLPAMIKDSVFKNILTTKGSKGTGLGLYLAYSVIKGEFSGDITFESVDGEGTTFYIMLNRADTKNTMNQNNVPAAAEVKQ